MVGLGGGVVSYERGTPVEQGIQHKTNKHLRLNVFDNAPDFTHTQLDSVVDVITSGRGTTSVEDAQGTPTQNHVSQSIPVYMMRFHEERTWLFEESTQRYISPRVLVYEDKTPPSNSWEFTFSNRRSQRTEQTLGHIDSLLSGSEPYILNPNNLKP